ncbi:MAG: hypothetical protein U9R44_04830 [Candidatus Omnitrophota bacterium]|nr:hypothetical protein [Candidatus Omnitrophota bacterium]
MKNRDLIRKMSRLGFPLLETGEVEDANRVLYEVSKSKETRLWEGFPILLANASKEGRFDYDKVVDLCRSKKEKKQFLDFVILSLSVYKYFHLRFWWISKLYKKFPESGKEKINVFLGFLRKNSNLKISNCELSSVRIKNIFENYFKEEKVEKKEKGIKHEGLSLEYALSQIFSPKQKVLFLMKLRGEKMTKTEREYYSRLVKKKIIALSNDELHKLSQTILES